MENSLCVCDIAAKISMTHSAVSHQLKILKQARLVKSEKKGKEEKVSKFSKLLPMGKTKKETVQEGIDNNTEVVAAPVENTATTLNTSDDIKDGGKKKWEIDQRICYRKCIMTRCYLTNEKNVKDIKARFIKNT